MKLKIAAIGAGTALALLTAPVSAATITGETVGIVQLYPTQGKVYLDLGTAEVAEGIEATAKGIAVDVDGSSLTLTATANSAVAGGGSFNGIRISDFFSAFGDFTSFGIVNSTFGEGVATDFDADNLFVNLDAVGSFTEGQSLTANFTVEDLSAVPLPAAGWLLMAGAGLLGAIGRRRRS